MTLILRGLRASTEAGAVHSDLVTDGLVAPDGITTADGSVIGAGDRILTRSNNRTLRTGSGYVRNGDLWQVVAIGDDGSMTVTPLSRRGRAVTDDGPEVVLPASYASTHVELGYATTTHRAQGITVDTAHLLASPGMVRENLYVGMTRGRDANHVYVAVDDVDPACDDLPDPHAAPDGRDVLTRILATCGAERSATATLAANQNAAASLHRLEPIRQTLLADAAHAHWVRVLAEAGLDPATVDGIVTSPACGPLFTALGRAHAIGADVPGLLARLVAGIAPTETGVNVGAVLRARVDDWLHTQVEDPTAIHPTSPNPDPSEVTDLIAHVDQLIADRVAALTDHALTAEPSWLGTLGEPPADPAAQAEWLTQVAAAAARADHERPTVTRSATPVHVTPATMEGTAR